MATQFTCRACRLVFRDRAEMAEHYKSSLHVINVGNRIEGKPAMTREQHETISREPKREPDELSESDDDWVTDEGNSEDEVEVTPTRSLFDDHTSDTWEENMDYMKHKFGFYFPNEPKLVDKEGLLAYLERKVNGGMCIYCGKIFSTHEAVREHMGSKGHRRIRWIDNEAEFAEFYEQSLPNKDLQNFHTADGRVVKAKTERGPLNRPGFARLRDHMEVTKPKKINGYLQQRDDGTRSESAMRHLQVAARGSHMTISKFIDGAEKSQKHLEPVAKRAVKSETKKLAKVTTTTLTSQTNNRKFWFEGRGGGV